MGTGRLRRRASLAAVGMVLAAGCSWGQFGHDASRTGWSPAEDVITTANVASLAPLWQGPTSAVGARIAHGTIYSIEGPADQAQRLVAFDAAGNQGCSGSPRTCAPKWSANLSLRLNHYRLYDGVAVEGDRVYVVGWVPFFAGPFRMEVFDAHGREGCSGVPVKCAPLWSASWGIGGGNSPAGPNLAVSNGRIYVNTPIDPSTVSVFDAAGVAGCNPGPPRTCSSLFTTGPISGGSIAVGEGKLAVSPFNNVSVKIYDAAGQQGCTNQVCSPLAAVRGLQNSSVANGHLYGVGGAFDLATAGCPDGEPPLRCGPTFTTAFGPSPLRFPPVVAAGQVYLGERIGDVQVFDAAGVAGCAGEPKVCEPQASLVHNGSTLALAATKSLVFVATSASQVDPPSQLRAYALASPSTCEGSVPRRCQPLWSVDLRADAGFAGPISIANGIVAVAYDNGGFDVFALRS
jgi:outer membrane protein assembly factor BamB